MTKKINKKFKNDVEVEENIDEVHESKLMKKFKRDRKPFPSIGSALMKFSTFIGFVVVALSVYSFAYSMYSYMTASSYVADLAAFFASFISPYMYAILSILNLIPLIMSIRFYFKKTDKEKVLRSIINTSVVTFTSILSIILITLAFSMKDNLGDGYIFLIIMIATIIPSLLFLLTSVIYLRRLKKNTEYEEKEDSSS